MKCFRSCIVLGCIFGSLSIGTAFSAGAKSKVNKSDRPNILFIAVDDLKPTLGCYGDSLAVSPNIDKLAMQSFVFRNNHCQQALCGPSRASLLTGRYPHQLKIWGFDKIRDKNPDVLTLPQYFKNSGYTTVSINKIFDKRTVNKGLDSISWTRAWPLAEEDLIPYYSAITGSVSGYFYHNPKVKRIFQEAIVEAALTGKDHYAISSSKISPATECLVVPDNAYKDGVFAIRAIEELKKLSIAKKPFFLGVGFERPHLPYTAPKKYWDLIDTTKIKLPKYQKIALNDTSLAYTFDGEIVKYSDENGDFIYKKLADGQWLTAKEQRKLTHGYYAAVAYIDAQVGKVLKTLDSLGLSKNTIVVLWSDHGYHLYDHGMWGKYTNFEQSTSSPLIIRDPSAKPGVTTKATGLIDIYPTLCKLSGLEIPAFCSGTNLTSLMTTGKGNDMAISQYIKNGNLGISYRNERYRMVIWYKNGPQNQIPVSFSNAIAFQLFDYQKDPDETINLATNSDYKKIREALTDKIENFLNKTQ